MTQKNFLRWVMVIFLVGSIGLGTWQVPSAFGDGKAYQTTSSEQMADPAQAGNIKLTLIHSNDGESQLISASGQPEFGGVARFASVVDNIRGEVAAEANHVSLTVTSGDNFLAGPEFNASLERGIPFYDSIALELIGYDAMDLGNHDFDFGPDTLADFIDSFFEPRAPVFLSSNLDFSQEPRLQALFDAGRIAKSVVITRQGEQFGIVGATTSMLPVISSPGLVKVDPNVAGAIQAQIDQLTARGVNKIIVISHLQSVEEDMALAPMLSGVDIMVAGGGDELLANSDDLLIPGEEGLVFGPYPMMGQRADGRMVPIVTTNGDYKYVGRLEVTFDSQGEVVEIGSRSGPVRVASTSFPDGVEPDPAVQALVTDPVQTYVGALGELVIGVSEVALDGRRNSVRGRETNQGNLVTDAYLTIARAQADRFGAGRPDVAMTNGGGIRNDSIIPAGNITELDTLNMLPFANFLAIVEDVTPAEFKALLENAYSFIDASGNPAGGGTGRFAQISGFTVVYDSRREVGSRVITATLNDGTVIIADGAVASTARNINIASIDFLARGGDEWNFGGRTPVILGRTYQQTLSDYIRGPLSGRITAAQYPEGGEGRIVNLAVQ